MEWELGKIARCPFRGYRVADRTPRRAAEPIIAAPGGSPIFPLNDAFRDQEGGFGKQVSCRRAPANPPFSLPLGLQTHLLTLLPPQLPAPLEVHFLHGCDLRGRRDMVSATPVSGRKCRPTMNDTTAGSAVQQSLSFPHPRPHHHQCHLHGRMR